jgi:beta-glucuronidase
MRTEMTKARRVSAWCGIKTVHVLAGCVALAGAGAIPAATGDASLTPLIANVGGRATQSLDGTWQTIVDPYGAGYLSYHARPLANGYFKDARPKVPSDRVEYDFDASPTLEVPGDWNSQRPELFFYEGPLWYRKKFDHAAAPGRRTFVHFGAVNRAARVFLNGEPVGEHEGGFTPFNFEVTGQLRQGENSLVVLADNGRVRDGVPTLMTDWWNYGGITRPVRLVDLPATFVEDYFLYLEAGSERIVRGHLRLNGPRRRQRVEIRIPEAGAAVTVETDDGGYAPFRLEADLELWSPGSPKLYEVEIAAETDAVADTQGFRTVEVRGTEILLNGEPVFLRGISVHEEAPHRGGRAWSEADARTLLGWVRELGGNFVRLAHYPHNETMVRAAERLGILVWSEIPVYWTISWDNPATLASARQQLAESITRDRNRAAVLLWSVANETPVSDARNAFLGNLIDLARELDPSRLVTAALQARYADETTMVIDDPIGARLDVMGNNEYIGWYDGSPEKCDRIAWRSPYQKPLIMSELGGGAKAGRHGDAGEIWTEEFQESLYEHQVGMLERIPFLRGTSPWILMDFRSPRRPLPGIQDFWNRKGLVSEQGERKKAFFVLQRWYRELARTGAR